MQKENSIEVGGQFKKRLVGLKYNALRDYLVARQMFFSNSLREACILGNQAIEKDLKAYIEASGGKSYKHHETYQLWHILNQQKPDIASKINKSFLKVLSQIYRTRYFENLEEGFSYTILKYKFLAELDYTFQYVHNLVTGKSKGNNKDVSLWNEYVSIKMPLLISENYVLNGVDKATFLNQKEFIEQFLIFDNSHIIVLSELARSCENESFEFLPFRITGPTTLELADWSKQFESEEKITPKVLAIHTL